MQNNSTPDDGAAPAKKTHCNSNRNILQSDAERLVRRGDLTGAQRGVFQAGLAACALGAPTAAEALPFAKQFAAETQEPGWMTAQSALAADSSSLLEALDALGLLDLGNDMIWTGYRSESGDAERHRTCFPEAILKRAPRCVEFLISRLPTDGMLAAAARSRDPACFELLLADAAAKGSQRDLDAALAELAADPNQRSDTPLLLNSEMAGPLLDAGADLAFRPGPIKPWHSWNGSTPQAMADAGSRAWVPALRLGEPDDALPEGASADGSMDPSLFFSGWSSACLLARAAVEGGQRSQPEAILTARSGWELASADGGFLTPLSLLAMADPATTDSQLSRTRMAPHELILASPLLQEALSDTGPMSLAKSAVGGWLWGKLGATPLPAAEPQWRPRLPRGIPSDPLVEGISLACSSMDIRPLGISGGCAASQEFVAQLRCLGPSPREISPWLYNPGYESQAAASERLENDRVKSIETQEREAKLAAALGQLMPPDCADRLSNAVALAHANAHIAGAAERLVFAEQLILGLSPSAASSRRSPSL